MDTTFLKHNDAELENEIAELKSRLVEAKRRLNSSKRREAASSDSSSTRITPLMSRMPTPTPSPEPTQAISDTSQHYLLLLADSALPLGSFAFSSGLESYLAHARSSSSSSSSSGNTYLYKPSLTSFLPLSVSSYASTTLPFVLAAHRSPNSILELDDALDASIVCTVGRRASVAQGRALLSIWEKSLSPSLASSSSSAEARRALEEFSACTPSSSSATAGEETFPIASAHLAPLFGSVSKILGLDLRQTAYVFLLGHVKALVSAAVRAGMFGPYQAQKVLAGPGVRALITDMVEREWDVGFEVAGQSVPVMDLWIGRHEKLYSRIFNS